MVIIPLYFAGFCSKIKVKIDLPELDLLNTSYFQLYDYDPHPTHLPERKMFTFWNKKGSNVLIDVIDRIGCGAAKIVLVIRIGVSLRIFRILCSRSIILDFGLIPLQLANQIHYFHHFFSYLHVHVTYFHDFTFSTKPSFVFHVLFCTYV